MDPNVLIEALRGTMDPNLREAAERQLNEVKTCDGANRASSVVSHIKDGMESS